MRSIKQSMLGVALIATLSLSFSATARAASSDTSAIASFLSIGFANASTNFSSIRGKPRTLGYDQYAALKWPDRALFASCYTEYHPKAGPGSSKGSVYTCESTPRSVSRDALFATIARSVSASLPSGYTSEGEKTWNEGGIARFQLWGRPGFPDVRLFVRTDRGKAFYEIAVANNNQLRRMC